MDRSLRIAPDTLRAISLGLLIVAVLPRILHWPWTDAVLVIAWLVAVAVVVARIAAPVQLTLEVAVRDLFFIGIVSVLAMTMLHLPGRGVAWAILALGALGTLWFGRFRYLPLKGSSSRSGWFFTAGSVLILVGAFYKIQHWPYSTELLIGGLVSCAVWFFWSMRSEGKE